MISNPINQGINGSPNIPGDKSISIRIILIASQAIGKSRAYNLLESGDVKSTINSMKKLSHLLY